MVPYIDMSNYEEGGCLHHLFTKQATKTPNKTAVVCADGKEVQIVNYHQENVSTIDFPDFFCRAGHDFGCASR